MLAICVLSAAAMAGSSIPVMAEETKTQKEETQKEETDSAEEADSENTDNSLEDGVYTAEFHTDSRMFHVNEAKDGKGILTVQDGEMTIHVSLVSKSIVNLFPGLAEDAKKEGAELLEPTTDQVTYSDGYTEEVYGFDIPVPVLEEEFDCALLGKKGKWYDHKVSVTSPVPAEETEETGEKKEFQGKTAEDLKLEDGNYKAEVALEGGSGKATVESPASLTVQEGKITAVITWSSPNYDYMVVDGEKYQMTNKEGNSTFEIPVAGFDEKIKVKADTVAMSEPHEIDYTLLFDSQFLKESK